MSSIDVYRQAKAELAFLIYKLSSAFSFLAPAGRHIPFHRDLAPVQIDLAVACTDSGKLSRKCEYPP